MRILMLGNSYTFYNDMPKMLEELMGVEVVAHTKGGAKLTEQLDITTETGAKTQKALTEEHWDYVVVQEYSRKPVLDRESFLESVATLCEQIRKAGGKPVLYLTWPYQKGGAKMQETGLEYEMMYHGLQEAYREAAKREQALLADVGTAFYERRDKENLYVEDGTHPNETGSRLAAQIIADTIRNDLGKMS